MKRWKAPLILIPLIGIGAGIGVWQFRPQVEVVATAAYTRAAHTYATVASRLGLPVPAAMKHQEAGSSGGEHSGHQMQAEPKSHTGHTGQTTPSMKMDQSEHSGHEMPAAPKAASEHAGHGTTMEPKAQGQHAGHGATMESKETPAGQGSMPSMGTGGIMLSTEKQQLMGVTMGKVERKPLVKVIRTVGTVESDETRIAHVHIKIKGWIEELSVDFTGQLVEKEQLLFTLYSPELVATQEEYLLALKAKNYLGDSPFQEVSSGGHSVLEATRRRLRLWDITEEQIKELEQTGQPKKNLAFYSPIGGYVTEKHALKGMAVTPGMALYTITDLSKVWVLADIYEQDLSLVKPGQEAKVTIASYPGEVFTGKVIYIYPYMESATRTVKIRLELDNTAMKLKPKMFANVLIKVDLGHQLTVPDGAILDSGSRQIAFVSVGEGHFEPRDVTLGPKVDDHFVILKGLKEGEKIVTSATFLVDSESQLKSAVGGMAGHQH